MRTNTLSISLLGAFFVLFMFGHQQAHGQSTANDSYVYSVGGWDLVEVRDNADQVMGYWGIPRVAVGVGNIRRLWFESIPNNDWAVWAFEPVAIYDKVDGLIVDGASTSSIAFVMFQEFLAADTAINQDVNGGVSGLVVKGFIAGDPLVNAAGSLANPTPMIDLLAGVGYPIAPGMSNLLVDGTAGASVGMNATTKQTLDCMRTTSSVCGGCVCVKAEQSISYGPWSVTQSQMTDLRIRCVYTRAETHLYWQWGEYPYDCTDCTIGSAQAPASYVVDVRRVEFWFDITTCPPWPQYP